MCVCVFSHVHMARKAAKIRARRVLTCSDVCVRRLQDRGSTPEYRSRLVLTTGALRTGLPGALAQICARPTAFYVTSGGFGNNSCQTP